MFKESIPTRMSAVASWTYKMRVLENSLDNSLGEKAYGRRDCHRGQLVFYFNKNYYSDLEGCLEQLCELRALDVVDVDDDGVEVGVAASDVTTGGRQDLFNDEQETFIKINSCLIWFGIHLRIAGLSKNSALVLP